MKKFILFICFLVMGCATFDSGRMTASREKKEIDTYHKLLKKRIYQYVYKDYGITFYGTGEAQVKFFLSSSGFLKDCSVDTGQMELDVKLKEGILNAVKKASPFPPFPKAMHNKKEQAYNIIIEVKGLNLTKDELAKRLRAK